MGCCSLRTLNPIQQSRNAIGADGMLIPLEHNTDVTIHSKVKPLPGYAAVKTFAEFQPGRSSVRLNADSAHFVIRDRAPIDPSSRYELRLLKSSKRHRQLEMVRGHGTLFGASATSAVDDNAMPLRFDDYGLNSYRITPEHPLAPGEYAFSLRGVASDLYCFGIDH